MTGEDGITFVILLSKCTQQRMLRIFVSDNNPIDSNKKTNNTPVIIICSRANDDNVCRQTTASSPWAV